MPFQKGNTLATTNKGKIGMRMKMHNEVAEQIISLSPAYNEKLMCLNEGIKLDAPQKEFMDRFERMYEFARPKLARKEVVGEGGGPVAHSVKISFE